MVQISWLSWAPTPARNNMLASINEIDRFSKLEPWTVFMIWYFLQMTIEIDNVITDNEHPAYVMYVISLNLCGIVVAILKMATGRNFSMSGINSGHHNLTTYEMSLKLNIVEFGHYCGSIFKMAATIPHRFNIVRFQRHFICG
jgi:putative Mn2+ efflux pump MntP